MKHGLNKGHRNENLKDNVLHDVKQITPESGVGGGSGSSFVDVFELPQNPNPNTIYRVNKPELYFYSEPNLITAELAFSVLVSNNYPGVDIKFNGVNIIPVTSLPSNPLYFSEIDESIPSIGFNIYIMNDDIYACHLSESGEIVWAKNNELFTEVGTEVSYKGVINSLDTSTMQDGDAYLNYTIKYINVTEKEAFNFATDNYKFVYESTTELTADSNILTFNKVYVPTTSNEVKIRLSHIPTNEEYTGFELESKSNGVTLLKDPMSSVPYPVHSFIISGILGQIGFITTMYQSSGVLLRIQPLNGDNTSFKNFAVGTYTLQIYIK